MREQAIDITQICPDSMWREIALAFNVKCEVTTDLGENVGHVEKTTPPIPEGSEGAVF
jgi:hypothetical protein